MTTLSPCCMRLHKTMGRGPPQTNVGATPPSFFATCAGPGVHASPLMPSPLSAFPAACWLWHEGVPSAGESLLSLCYDFHIHAQGGGDTVIARVLPDRPGVVVIDQIQAGPTVLHCIAYLCVCPVLYR